MTKIFNKISEKEKRRKLRNNMTKAEVLLWLKLKNRQILGIRFLRQYSVWAYVIDFYAPEVKLAIEADGATHVTKEEIEYDKIRQEEIENLNIRFSKFKNEEIYEKMDLVIDKIEKEIKIGLQ